MIEKQTRVVVLNSVSLGNEGEWKLCFQYCRYEFCDYEELGYRFIWKKPNGNLQGARGQAKIPSISDAMVLMSMAIREGWGHHNGNLVGNAYVDIE
jgi:hypothetical protein